MTKEEFAAFVDKTLFDMRMTRREKISMIVEQWEQDIFDAWKLGEQVQPAGLPQGVYRTGEDL